MIKINKNSDIIKQRLKIFFKEYRSKHNQYTGKEIFESYIVDEERKNELKQILLKEQNYLCCYCMSKISDKNMTIEHFKPKSIYKDLSIDYTNLLASCRNKGQCDNSKKDKEIKELYNPADKIKNIEDQISYNLNGEIILNEVFLNRNDYNQNRITQLMKEINEILNLNNPNLIRNRKKKCQEILKNSNDKKKLKKIVNIKPEYYGFIVFCINNILKKLKQNE